MKTPIKVLALLVPLALLAGCSSAAPSNSSSSAADAKPYQILVVAGVTGPSATFASTVAKAIKLEAGEITKAGGIDGRPVKVTVADSGGDPTKAVSQLQQALAGGTQPDLVYAGISSAESLAMLPILTRDKILSVAATSNAAINDPTTYPYHFGIAPVAANQLKTLVGQLKANKVKKLSVLVSNDVFGQGTQAGLTSVLKDDSAVKATYYTYNTPDVDYSTAYQRAVADNPDAVFMDGNGDAVGRLLKARQNVAPDIPAFGGAGITSIAPGSVVDQSALKGFKSVVYKTTQYVPTAQQPKSLQTFLKGMDFGTTLSAFNPMLGADSILAVALAAKQAKSTDTVKVAKAMESLKAPKTKNYFLAGTVTFTPTNHFAVLPDSAFAWITPSTIKDGLWVTAQ